MSKRSMVAVLVAVIAALGSAQALVYTQGRGGFPPPGPGGFGQQDRELVAQFDRDGNERLDAAERGVAREFLVAERLNQAQAGGFGRGRGGFPGGPGGRGGGRGAAPTSPGRRLTPADVRSYQDTVPVYDINTLRTIFIEFEDAGWESELELFYRTDVEVPARVTIDNTVYRDVGIHFRGQSSFMFAAMGSKRSLNLSFDFVDEDQDVGGYRTFNLLNATSDPTFVRAVLYSEIARKYIPAPAANFMRVVINGESWGVYVNAAQFNTDFTRDYFQSRRGARWQVPGSPNGRGGMEYLGPDIAAYKPIYEIRTRDTAESWNALITLFRTLNQTPPERLEAALAPMLDIDGALKFLALEVAMVNSDGYWARASDYSIYQDEGGKFHVIPHDMNEGLAEETGPGGGRGGFGGGGGVRLDPLVGLNDTSKPLRSKLLAVPELRQRYLTYVREIATQWLDWQVVEPRVRAYQALIGDEVTLDTRKLYATEAFASGVIGLRSFLEARRAYLLSGN